MTKALTKVRRCQWCQKRFSPRFGGRPAQFCSNTCRQRAFVARKRSRSDGAHANPTPPMARAPLLITTKKPFFTPEDAAALFEGHRQADLDVELDFIAENCVRISHDAGAATPSKRQKELRSAMLHGAKFLAAFGLRSPIDHLDGQRTLQMLGELLQSIPHDLPMSLYLREHFAREILPSEIPGEWRVFRATLRGMELMMVCLQLADDAAEAAKRKRKAPPEEIHLVGALRDLWERETNDDHWYTTPIEGAPHGPFVDLVCRVAGHIHDHLDAVEPVPSGMAAHMKALSTRPWRVRERIDEFQRIKGRTAQKTRSISP